MLDCFGYIPMHLPCELIEDPTAASDWIWIFDIFNCILFYFGAL